MLVLEFFRVAGWALSLSLSFLLALFLSRLALTLSNLNTIHSPTLALISPLVRPPFRVGLEEKLLLVSDYAWTPRSWTTVEVWATWVGKLTRIEVSGPYRTNYFAFLGWS